MTDEEIQKAIQYTKPIQYAQAPMGYEMNGYINHRLNKDIRDLYRLVRDEAIYAGRTPIGDRPSEVESPERALTIKAS